MWQDWKTGNLCQTCKVDRLRKLKAKYYPISAYTFHSCAFLTFKKASWTNQMCSSVTFSNSDRKHTINPAFTKNSMFTRTSSNNISFQQQRKGIINTKHTWELIKSLKINTGLTCFSSFLFISYLRGSQVSLCLNKRGEKRPNGTEWQCYSHISQLLNWCYN